MEVQLAALDQDEAKRLSDLAKTYQEMQPARAAEILDQMPVDDVVKILGQMTKAKDRAKIVESMKKSLQISEALISGMGN
jgi:flagellar motility protein MotE (MotC chaperone)